MKAELIFIFLTVQCMGISIKINNLDATLANIERKTKKLEKELSNELNAWAINVATKAKQNAPTDEGHLKGAINPDYVKGELRAGVTVAVNYAAYIEFGTRKFAASYVSSLPSDWQTFAAEFKGRSGGGDYFDFLNNILDWVIRKGIANRYSVKTQSAIKINLEKPSKGATGKDDYNRLHDAAYMIALSILKNGIKQHPFLFPATQEANKEAVTRIKALLEK